MARQISIKEYIGARYVPMFYDDGTGSAEWSDSVEYEPLTIVLHEGNSYTSRQYVPTGIAITNERYWLETGNWNSQIESYRREVLGFSGRIESNEQAITAEETARIAGDSALTTADQQLSDRIQTLAGRVGSTETAITRIDSEIAAVGKIHNVVAIGDSWGDGWNGSSTITSWIEYMRQYAGITTLHQAHEGGAGFYSGGNTSGKNFTGLLMNVVAAMTEAERAAVQVVIAAGGINDKDATVSQIMNSISTFCTASKQNFPNAKILIGNISAVNMVSAWSWNSLRTLEAYTQCGRYGAAYIVNSENIPFICQFSSEGAHLTNYAPVGQALAGALETGSVDIQNTGAINFWTENWQEIDWHPTCNCFIANGTATIALENHRWAGLNGKTLSWVDPCVIGHWESPNIPLTRGYGFIGTVAMIVQPAASGWVGGTGILRLAPNGEVSVRFVNSSGITFENINAVCVLGGWLTQTSKLA